ncbi:hypothetical protein D7Y05_03190 [bacterium 1XD42-54]|jgi:hypothetical protein|nr:hypothetical protein D7Y05_03190 [bacterium 1XD42-54]
MTCRKGQEQFSGIKFSEIKFSEIKDAKTQSIPHRMVISHLVGFYVRLYLIKQLKCTGKYIIIGRTRNMSGIWRIAAERTIQIWNIK